MGFEEIDNKKGIVENPENSEKVNLEKKLTEIDFETIKKLPDDLLDYALSGELLSKIDDSERQFSLEILSENDIKYSTTELLNWWRGNGEVDIICLYDGSRKIFFDSRNGEKINNQGKFEDKD
jgi:hypothetical protein